MQNEDPDEPMASGPSSDDEVPIWCDGSLIVSFC